MPLACRICGILVLVGQQWADCTPESANIVLVWTYGKCCHLKHRLAGVANRVGNDMAVTYTERNLGKGKPASLLGCCRAQALCRALLPLLAVCLHAPAPSTTACF